MKIFKKITNDHFMQIFLIVVVLAILNMVALFWTDNDMYFIIATGREIIENGVPYVNPFFVMDDLKIIVQQWLAALVTAGLYDHFGYKSLLLLCAVFAALNGCLIYKIGKIINEGKNRMMLAIIAGVLLFLMIPFNNIRPTIFTITLLLWQIYCLEKYVRTVAVRWLWFLPLISFLEINLHGSMWIVHFVFLMPYVVPAIKNPLIEFRNQGSRFRFSVKVVLVFALMFAAGLVNPYGVDGIMYLFNSYGQNLTEITEIKPFAVNEYYGMVLFVSSIIFALKLSKKQGVTSNSFYMACGGLLMALPHARNIIYYCIAIVPITYELFGNSHITLPQKAYCHTTRLLILPVCILTISTFFHLGDCADLDIIDSSTTPVQAVQRLNEAVPALQRENTKVFTEFNNGGYFEFYGYKTYLDPRPELFTKKINRSDEVFKEYSELAYTQDHFQGFLEKYRFDYLCSSKETLLDYVLSEEEKYMCVVETETYRLWKENETMNQEVK